MRYYSHVKLFFLFFFYFKVWGVTYAVIEALQFCPALSVFDVLLEWDDDASIKKV